MSQNEIAIVTALIGAVVTLITWAIERPKWKVTSSQVRKFVLSLGLGMGTWVLLFLIGSAIFGQGDHAKPTASAINTKPPTSSTGPPATTSSTTTTTTIVQSTDIKITRPPKRSNPHFATGPTINVSGSGVVPKDKHLWVFVYAPDVHIYYPDNEILVTGPDQWELPLPATLGGSAPGDVNALYVVYAVLVDKSVNRELTSFFQANQGTQGYRNHLPSGMKPVDWVTVRRTH